MEGLYVKKEGRQTDAPTNPPAAVHDVRGGIKGEAHLLSPLGDGAQGGDGHERGDQCLSCGRHCVKLDAAGICDECKGGVFRVQDAGRESERAKEREKRGSEGAREQGSEGGGGGEGDGGGWRLVLCVVHLHA